MWFRDELEATDDPVAPFRGLCNVFLLYAALAMVAVIVAAVPYLADVLAGWIVRWGL